MIDIFTKLICGVFNNKLQAFSHPFDFPQVRYNIEILPYKFEGKQTLFRVEQYRISQGLEPYRIGYISVEKVLEQSLLMRNFLIPDYPNFQTASHLKQIDNTLEYDVINTSFKGTTRGTLRKDSKLIMVMQDIDLRPDTLRVLDRGYDMATNKLLWGSDYGAFELKKEKNYATTSRID